LNPGVSEAVSSGLVSNERGVALALALFAMVIVGALVGSSFSAALLEQQSGRNSIFAAQAREGAELGLSEASGSISPAALAALTPGGPPLVLDPISLGNGVFVSREVTRLTSGLFLIRARADRRSSSGSTLASRSLGVMVRPALPADTLLEIAESRLERIERGWVQLY